MQLRRKFQTAGPYLVIFHNAKQQRLLCDLLNQYKLTTEHGDRISHVAQCDDESCSHYFAFNNYFRRGTVGSSKYTQHRHNGCVTVPFEDIFTKESLQLYHKFCTSCQQSTSCSYCNLGTNFKGTTC